MELNSCTKILIEQNFVPFTHKNKDVFFATTKNTEIITFAVQTKRDSNSENVFKKICIIIAIYIIQILKQKLKIAALAVNLLLTLIQ